MTIDGRAIAQDILEKVRAQVNAPLVMRAIVVSPTPATASYLKAKARAAETAGITFEVVELTDTTSTQDVIEAVQSLGADVIIVQLPLPPHIDTDAVLAAIPATADADALSPAATVTPPVAAAVEEILVRSGVAIADANAIVIGKGRLVGAPVAAYLSARGALVSSYDVNDFAPDVLAGADIIVSGIGVPHFVKPDMVKEGVVLIDAGTSEPPTGEESGIVGDIDPAAAQKAALYTPVPGGVGPVTVACLMRNAAQLRTGNIQVL